NGASGAASTRGSGMISFFITMAIYILLLSNFLAPRLVNREGKSLYLLSLAPVSSRDVLLVKWALGAIPVAALTVTFAIVGALLLHLSFWAVLLCLCAFGTLAIAMIGAMLNLSLIWPRLDWDNPSRQVSTQAVLYGTVGGLVLAMGICALLAVAIGWSSSHQAIALLAGVGIFVITLGACWISLIVGSRTMKSLLGGTG
ncbi:MAG: putative ABC transporter permease subunit, partial [Chloroflexota bacterium]